MSGTINEERTVSIEADLLGAFEEHSPDRIRELLAAGVSPMDPINGTRPIDSLIGMYLRSTRFAECLQIMLIQMALEDRLRSFTL